MLRLTEMHRLGHGGRRVAGAALMAAALACCVPRGPAWAATATTPPSTGTAATTTTLPPLPKVPLAYTAGQPAGSLLSNAISLSSLGLDNSALLRAVAATQARLDADATTARIARAQSEAAARREALARASLAEAQAEFSSMQGAVRAAVVYLYTAGPDALALNPRAGQLLQYAGDYAASTIGPYGVLERRQAVERQRAAAMGQVADAARQASAASHRASKALADERGQLDHLKAELDSASTASAAAVAADHLTLAGQAGKELLADSSLQFTPKKPVPAPVSTTPVALTWAFAELGKQYVWGATGPNTFDCSGLTQFVWKAAGVAIPRVAADQDAWTIPVPLSELLPGDLVFFGTTDIHHVGIYIGNGLMINAPHTGTVVQVSSIWWSDLAGFGRVHYPGTPIPPHDTPRPSQPAAPAVVAGAGPVPSQTAPPPGWKPSKGSTTPIVLGPAGKGGAGRTTTSTSTSTSTSTTSTSAPTATTTTAPGSTTTLGPGSPSGAAVDPAGVTTTTTVPYGPAPAGP